jgi:hypothetical protein
MTKINLENLNVRKFVLVLAIPFTVFYFVIFNRDAPDHVFYLFVNLVASPLAAVITAFLLGLAIGIAYEVLKFCRPFFEWLFK